MKRSWASMLCGLWLIAGCAGTPSVAELGSRNRERLDDLAIGMSRSQVTRLMGPGGVEAGDGSVIGNPYRREAALGPDGASLDVLYYCTGEIDGGADVTDRRLTPVVFRDGHVIGWGWSFLERRAAPAMLPLRAASGPD